MGPRSRGFPFGVRADGGFCCFEGCVFGGGFDAGLGVSEQVAVEFRDEMASSVVVDLPERHKD